MKTNEHRSNTQQNKVPIKRILLEVIIVIVLVVPAIVAGSHLKQFVIQRVLKAVELKPNAEGYKTWLNPPTIITRDYYLFNITNPIGIVTDPTSTTVRVKETPPYSYLLSATKKDVQWSDDEKSLNYSIYRLFTRHETRFNPSCVDDKGTFVDLLRATFRTQFKAKADDAFFVLGGKNTFYERNAIEQLEGFTSELFERVREKMTGPNTNKSGFIYRYNGSRSYSYTIKSGMN
jgi:CD36 family